MKRKLLISIFFFGLIGVFFLFKTPTNAMAGCQSGSDGNGTICDNEPAWNGLFPYSDPNKVDISITLHDGPTGNNISGDVELWSIKNSADSCGNSVQSGIDETKFANPNTDFVRSCVHEIWVKATGLSGSHYDFQPFCLNCSSQGCSLAGWNGQTVFYTIHAKPIPVASSPTPLASATPTPGVTPTPVPSPTPTPISKPDLEPKNVTVNGTLVSPGGTYNLTAGTVANINFTSWNNGPGPTTSTSSSFLQVDTPAAPDATYTVPTNLGSNDGTTHTGFSRSWAAVGVHTVYFRVDINSVLAEANEGNNQIQITINVTSPIVPAIPDGLAVGGAPSCVNRGSTYGTALNLNWNASANATSYTLRVTKDVKTGIDFGSKVSATTSATGTGSWSNNNNAAVVWVSGGNLAMVADTAYFFAVSATGAGGSSGYDLFNKSLQVGPVPLCNPADPSNLSVANSCDGANPQVTFTFTDNSTNEDNFYLDVNLARWGGDAAPWPWGYKIIAAHPGTGLVSYIWKVADPLTGGPPTVPVLNTTYYWRVLAHRTLADGTLADSNHVYPPNTLNPSTGVSFTTLSSATCQQESDLKAEFVDHSWRNSAGVETQIFDLSELVTIKVVVTNNSAVGSSPATKLYFYPDASVPYESGGIPDCTANPAISVPVDSNSNPQSYSVQSLGPGASSPEITISFRVSTSVANKTAYAYVVPTCSFSPALGIDPLYTNNQTGGFSYSVGAEGFFETQGGDVGVALGSPRNKIHTSFDSTTALPTARYQSDYMIAGTIDDLVHSKNGWMLDNYTQKQINSTSVYDYFWGKFKDKATPVACDFTSVAPIRHCIGNLNFGGTDAAPVGNVVYFVTGNLTISKNLALAAASSLVFVVSGDITVADPPAPASSVARVDGVYITKQNFADSDQPDPSIVCSGSGPLTVNGAIYADGNINMRRYFGCYFNHVLAPLKVVFQPKYLVQMIDTLGVKAINWKEVAP